MNYLSINIIPKHICSILLYQYKIIVDNPWLIMLLCSPFSQGYQGVISRVLPTMLQVMLLSYYWKYLKNYVGFFSQWNNNLASLSKGALGQTLTVNQLVDMEWKFGGLYHISSLPSFHSIDFNTTANKF